MSNLHFNPRYLDSSEAADSVRQPNLVTVPLHTPIQVSRAVQALTPYEAVSSQAAIEARPDLKTSFKLDWNESTIAPSPRVNAAIMAFLQEGRGLNWYPRLGGSDLLGALENYTRLSGEHLLVTNGSDDALGLVCTTFLDPGDDIVVPVPTYNHFMVFAQSRGAQVRTIEGDSPFDNNLDALRAAIRPDTRLVYLVSPNNPTGVIYTPEEVEALCEEFPATLFIVDEAYFEFAQITAIDLVRYHGNLIVTRTFSKAFGLAGLRVGYLAAHPELVQGLRRMYNPKSVNALGQIGAVAALEDLEYLYSFIAEVRQAKEILRRFFEHRGVEAHITPANFVVVRVDDIAHILEQLENRGVYVRDRSSYPGLSGCLRMTVGTVEQTLRLLERLQTVF